MRGVRIFDLPMKMISSLFMILAAALFSCRSTKTNYEDVNKLAMLKKIAKSKDDIYRYYKFDVHLLDLKPGQTIADIGGFDGIWDGIYSVFTDYLTFYVEDITSAGFTRCDSIMEFCALLKGKDPQCAVFKTVGTDSSTGLPSKIFDKVICNESFHHFTHPNNMFQDISRILKPGGKLYIRDSLRKGNGKRQSHFHYSLDLIKECARINGFVLLEDHSTKHMAFLVFRDGK
jgi:SAM-dependent methyltransferase